MEKDCRISPAYASMSPVCLRRKMEDGYTADSLNNISVDVWEYRFYGLSLGTGPVRDAIYKVKLLLN